MVNRVVAAELPRILPELNDSNRAFWTGGRDGQLLIQYCQACSKWVHPPVAACPDCGGEVVAKAVSGRGTVFTFTVNQQQFHPDVPPPYVIAIVVLDEQDDLRIPTNIVNCPDDDLRVGLPVQVLFEEQGEIFVPLFEPVVAS